MKVVTSNRKAHRNYDVIETYEAGMVLEGSEVKSLRANQADLKDSYAQVREGEVWLIGSYIAPYVFARDGGHNPERSRKLLMKRREIDRITGKLAEQGLTLVPLRIYFKDGRAKVELGLGKGRRTFDKRRVLREKEQQREMDRAMRRR